jgi:hypothetical protein
MAAAASSSSSAQLRSSRPSHVQELALLTQFVLSKEEAYQSFRYEPWTTKPRHADGLTLKASNLIPSTLGVHVQGSFKSSFVCNYPGALMWEELHEEFNKFAHCPTAVRVPVLDYLVDANTAKALSLANDAQEGGRFLVRVVLVGDPCAVGPLINSPRGLSLPANCKLETCTASRLQKHLSLLAGRTIVESDFLAVHRNHTSLSSGETELLQLYEHGSDDFWSHVGGPFCDQCCRRCSTDLLTCSTNGCSASRHVQCGAKREGRGSLYHCSLHLHSPPIPILDSSRLLQRTPPPLSGVRSSSVPEAVPSNLLGRLDSSAHPSAAAAAARLPRQAKDRAISAIAQSNSNPPTHNLPASSGAALPNQLSQIYYSSNWRDGLDFNCRALSVAPRPSTLPGAGQGLFEEKARAEGDLVGYFFGHFIPKQDSLKFIQEGPNYALLGRIPVEQARQAQQGVWWSFYAQGVEDSGNEYACIVDRQCPMGYINDPRDSKRTNCEVHYPKDIVQKADGSLPYCIFPIHATRPITAGEELFLDYNWTEADWKRSKSLVVARSKEVEARNAAVHAKYAKYTMDAGQRTPPPAASSIVSSSSSITPLSLHSRLHAIDRARTNAGFSSNLLANFELLQRIEADQALCESSESSHDHSSDSEIEQSGRTESLTRRVSAEVPRRSAPKLVIPKPAAAEVQLSEPLKQQIRLQWFQANEARRIKKLKKQPRRSLSSSSSSSMSSEISKVEDSRITRLIKEWTTITHCCATFTNLKEYMNEDEHAFKSPVTLNAARQQQSKDFKHEKKFLKQHLREQLKSNPEGAKIIWHGLPLCLSCFTFAIGWSRRTVYRAFQHVEVDYVPIPRQRAFITNEIAHNLATLALEEGQTNPLADTRPGQILLVLQYQTVDQARVRLMDVMAARNGGVKQEISESTFARARLIVSEEFGIDINLKICKKLAKCEKCEELQNMYHAAIKERNATDIAVRRHMVQEHNVEWMEQRFHFEEKKKEALRRPWMLNVATLDGMDTAKTNLPHYQRLTKHVDTAFTLPIRVVGAFYFGGPVPCMGMTSFEDVPSKGAAASVTAIETMINLQYEAMDETNIAPIPTEEEEEAARKQQRRAVALPDEIENVEGRQWSENEPKLPKVPFMWPEGLHLTFDNTSGDCKNTGTFRFLGMLVAIGVFCYITVSTLLVGHTHDIVDQMFSVWSRQLQATNATTLEELHTLFRNKYSSKIYELARIRQSVKAQRDQTQHQDTIQLSERSVN